MPTYLEEEVGQEFLDSIVSTYKAQYEAHHPEHVAPGGDDGALSARMEAFEVTGDSEAAALAINDARGLTVEPEPEIREKRGWRRKVAKNPRIGTGDDSGDRAS